jgi:hypothetical protein
VAVPDLGAVIEGDDGLVAVGPVVAGLGDGAVGDRDDRVAAVGVEVEAGVIAGPEAVLAEGGGDAIAGEGENPLVLLDLGRLLLRGLAHLLELGRAFGHLLLRQRDELGVGLLAAGVAGVVAADHGAAARERLTGDRADRLAGPHRGTGGGEGGDACAGAGDRAAGGDRQDGDTGHEGQGREPDHGAAGRRGGTSLAGHGCSRCRGASLGSALRSVVAHEGVTNLPDRQGGSGRRDRARL